MNTKLIESLNIDLIAGTLKRLGYPLFNYELPYNINMGVIRAKEPIVDAFDDVLYLLYRKKNDTQPTLKLYSVTCDPGSYWLKNLMDKGGTALLAEGFYRSAYKLGTHYGTEALVQVGAVSIYRDGNQDQKFDWDRKSITAGWYGINIHRHLQGVKIAKKVYNSSAGCVVWENDDEYADAMATFKMAVKYQGQLFSLAVIHENQIFIK